MQRDVILVLRSNPAEYLPSGTFCQNWCSMDETISCCDYGISCQYLFGKIELLLVTTNVLGRRCANTLAKSFSHASPSLAYFFPTLPGLSVLSFDTTKTSNWTRSCSPRGPFQLKFVPSPLPPAGTNQLTPFPLSYLFSSRIQ